MQACKEMQQPGTLSVLFCVCSLQAKRVGKAASALQLLSPSAVTPSAVILSAVGNQVVCNPLFGLCLRATTAATHFNSLLVMHTFMVEWFF